MKRPYRYNELDEMDYEAKMAGYDPAWDEPDVAPEMPQFEDFDSDDEVGAGIFGNELNHQKNRNPKASACVSNGKLFGHGEVEDILGTIETILAPGRDYHFEFGFFEAK